MTTRFFEYRTRFIQPAQAGDPISLSQLDAWLASVSDDTFGIETSAALSSYAA